MSLGGWKGLKGKSFGGVCCWGINKIEGFLKRVFVPHILKKGFLLPPCYEKPTPKVESDVDLSDLLDFYWKLWLRSEEKKL